MNDDIRIIECCCQRRPIENVATSGDAPAPLYDVVSPFIAGETDDLVSAIDQTRHETMAENTRRPGDEHSHVDRVYEVTERIVFAGYAWGIYISTIAATEYETHSTDDPSG